MTFTRILEWDRPYKDEILVDKRPQYIGSQYKILVKGHVQNFSLINDISDGKNI